MQTEVNIANLTHQLEGAKADREKLRKLERLCKNRDFKELILEDYCVQEAARLVHASIDPAHAASEQAKFLTMAQAAGGIILYLRAQERLLTTSANSISNIEQELEIVRTQPDEDEDEDQGEE